MTASIGVASFPAARIETVEDLFARADAALYRAKADGRNRVGYEAHGCGLRAAGLWLHVPQPRRP